MLVALPQTHKYNPHPRLSASQVGQYLAANATGRRRILQDAKFPPTAVLVPYDEAKSALTGHLARGNRGSTLDTRLTMLERKAEDTTLTDFKVRNSRLCAEALRAFQTHEAALKLGSVAFTKPSRTFPKLRISGVLVSVSIDLLTERYNKPAKGGAMLVFAKSAHTRKGLPERSLALSLLIYEVLKSQAEPDSEYDPKLCMVVDVFGGVVYRAKGEQKRLLGTVTTSCEEVNHRWPSISPPKSYNGPAI